MKTSEIRIRDPFVLTWGDRYYMYGTTDPHPWEGRGYGFDCYISDDLEQWDGPIAAFRAPQGFWADTQFWAPEVHEIDGAFYMFATFADSTAGHTPFPDESAGQVGNAQLGGWRGTAILRASTPTGPFIEHSDGPVTPPGWMCLDGTVVRSTHHDNQALWLVYCREWLEVGDGQIYAQRLSADLRTTQGEPIELLRASSAPWSVPIFDQRTQGRPAWVTDGPYFHTAQDGTLIMVWSSFGEHGYAVGQARSSTGEIDGVWQHAPQPLWATEGGHAMVFTDYAGNLRIALHAPNDTPNERAHFAHLTEAATTFESQSVTWLALATHETPHETGRTR